MPTRKSGKERGQRASATPRAAFVDVCAALGAGLAAAGFRGSQRGQAWKRYGKDGQFQARVFFQSLTTNTAADVALIPHLSVHAPRLASWWQAEHPRAAANDIVGVWSLAALGGLANADRWNVAGNDARERAELEALLGERALPLFACFDAVGDVVGAARALRAPFPASPKRWPVDVLLCFGEPGDAQAMLDAWWAGAPALPDNLRALLARLRATAPADVTDDDLAHAEFVGAQQWKLAHRHGLRVAPGA
jgi:hypothetical protein